jgi:hypothetical protein
MPSRSDGTKEGTSLPDLAGALLLLVKMPVVTRWCPYNAFADGPVGINRDAPPIAAA